MGRGRRIFDSDNRNAEIGESRAFPSHFFEQYEASRASFGWWQMRHAFHFLEEEHACRRSILLSKPRGSITF